MVLEARNHEHILFVTITYDNEHLPLEAAHPVTGEILYSHPSGVLDPLALRNFIKRVRKRFPPRSVRFFACGEYGDDTFRPHYHVLFFGVPFEKRHLLFDAWRDPITRKHMCSPDRFDIQIPKSDWDVGQYVAGYVMKKMTKADDVRLQGRTPEFFRSSQGIGSSSVKDLASMLDQLSGRHYIQTVGDIPRTFTVNGRSLPIDRYLRQKILAQLKISESANETSQANFAEEMRALSSRAAKNPKIPQWWLADKKRKGWALENQYNLEQAQAVKNNESKSAIHSNKKVL